jgi:polyferredoxin
MEAEKTKRCPFCKRDIPSRLIERHHIMTKGVDKNAVIPICNACHKTIHCLFSNREIQEEFHTVKSLLSNEKFASAIKFIKKQAPTSKINVKKAKKR